MLPWYFSEEAAAEKYMSQLQHNMWVLAARSAALSVITAGGKWVEIKTHADPLDQHLIVTASLHMEAGNMTSCWPVQGSGACYGAPRPLVQFNGHRQHGQRTQDRRDKPNILVVEKRQLTRPVAKDRRS
jgi:hypothetical protein